MTHQRTNIRNAAAGLLAGASIVPAGSVYTDRSLEVSETDLPFIGVRTLPETSSVRDFATTVLMRDMTVTVEVVASNTDDSLVATTVDSYCASVEAALAADPSWGGTVIEQHLTSTDYSKDTTGQTAVGRLTLKYTAKYFA